MFGLRVTNNSGFFDPTIEFIGTVSTITLNYNINLQSVTASGLFRFVLDYERLPFRCGWLILFFCD
jgi:hypothetical protein